MIKKRPEPLRYSLLERIFSGLAHRSSDPEKTKPESYRGSKLGKGIFHRVLDFKS